MHKKYIAFYLSLPRDQHDHNISNSLDALAKSHRLRSWDVLLVTTYKYLCSRGLIMIKFTKERNSRWCVILFMSSSPKFWKYFCVSCLFLLEGHREKKSRHRNSSVIRPPRAPWGPLDSALMMRKWKNEVFTLLFLKRT